MMELKRSILLLGVCVAASCVAQNWDRIKNNPDCLYGEGWGVTVAEADKQALNDLISKISVQVTGTTNHTEQELVDNSGINTQSQFEVAVTTFSQATLNNTEKIIIENEPDAHVGRWIRRSEVNKIFESRKSKILDYVSMAEKAESQGKIDVALKNLYWALQLLKSMQRPNELSYETVSGDKVLLITWIPAKINEIFSDLSVTTTKRTGNDLELTITYKGRPVNSIDYSYFDGRDWSNVYSAKDGVGVLELAPGNTADQCQLRFEYEYRGESRIDPEIESVMQVITGTPMRGAYKNIKTDMSQPTPHFALNEHGTSTFSQVPQQIFETPVEFQADSQMREAINKVLESITTRRYAGVDNLFTHNGLEIYKRLIRYGKAKIVGTPDLKFYKSHDNVTARGVQMSFSFSSGTRKSFVEDVVFLFDNDGKIDNISFGLGKTAEEDILGKGVWSENARFAIMSFLENYQTAYALKRLDYIERVFDDDAVIITATVYHMPSKRYGVENENISFNNDIIRYNRYSKDSFLKHLKYSFDSKEYINLRFADNDVRKLGKGGEMYAIQISQEYYSSNYGDKGYLFLIVDINDPENPIIKVRTWQPEKDPEFGIYGPEHFK